MAKYPAVITTMAGTNIIAEANASKQALIFTKIVIGAGNTPASIPHATSLTDKRLELEITKSVKTGDGQFTVQGLLSNKKLNAGFYAREIGLMAKAGEKGQEVLFSYTNGGNYVDYIPDKNTPMDSYTFTITTVIGNAEIVQAIVVDNGVASVHDLGAHNTDDHAHDNRFAMYLPLAGGTVTGNIRLNNAAVGFNNGNGTYDAKIRVAPNGNFDIGVTEDSANKNATNQLMLHSQNKPKWYNSDMGGKEIATTEDITNETSKYLLLAGGAITGDVNFANGAWVLFTNNNNVGGIRMLPNGTMDVGVNSQGTAPNINLCSNNRPGWYSPSAGIKQIAIVEDIDAAKKSLIETMDNYLPKAGGTVTGAIDFTRGSLKGHIELKPNGNLDFGSLETKCAVLNSRERPLWYTGDSRGGMLALTRDVIPDPTQCVNLYDAKSEKYQTGRDRGTFNLKAPYTDYDFLIIVLSADDGQFMGLSQINVSWFEKVRKMSIGTGLEIINIATVANCWWGISNKSTPTKMIAYDGYENSHLWEVWGYKITR